MLAALAAPALSCRDPAPASDAGSAPSASIAIAPPERFDAIVAAEHKRFAGGITAADQQSRDPALRRAAARALARIGGDAARPGLLRALADEDDDVVAWGAYGLGFFCKGHEKETVSALVARALSRPGEGDAPPGPAGKLDAGQAIARAVGKCGAEESEPTLVAWLAGPRDRAVAASFALGDLAGSKRKLREETIAALLNVAAGSAAAPPVAEAMFPLGRVESVPTSVVSRLREVAVARLAQAGAARIFAVKALSHGGDDGAVELARVLATPGAFTAPERAEAAKALRKIKSSGQRVLADSIPGLVPSADPVSLTSLVGEDFGVILAALDGLQPGSPTKAGAKALADLAALPAPPGAPASIVRRVSWLRCAAAKVLAGDDIHDKRLVACDLTTGAAAPPLGTADAGTEVGALDGGALDGGAPKPARAGMTPGSIGARAMVAVLDRSEITGARLVAFRELARSTDVRAREAALDLLKTHDEIEGAAALLTEALLAKDGGTCGTAAEVIADKPQRAGEAPKKLKKGRKKKPIHDEEPPRLEPLPPSPALIKALLDALARRDVLDDPEIGCVLADAAGALALKEAKPRLEELCRSPYPTTREHAQKALGLVSGEKRACDLPPEGGPAPDELGHLARAAVTLSLETDAGAMTITLDPTLAPVMVTRVADLARAGYYDGMLVHRVEPGFVTQFGAPVGDGFGGPEGKPSLRCETSPLPFVLGVVGVALSGRDTGSSQLFVMHASAPHLDGTYAIIGSATGPWAAFADGDLIRRVTVR